MFKSEKIESHVKYLAVASQCCKITSWWKNIVYFYLSLPCTNTAHNLRGTLACEMSMLV